MQVSDLQQQEYTLQSCNVLGTYHAHHIGHVSAYFGKTALLFNQDVILCLQTLVAACSPCLCRCDGTQISSRAPKWILANLDHTGGA